MALEKITTIDGKSLIKDVKIPKKAKVIGGIQTPDLVIQVKYPLNYSQKIKIGDKIYTMDKQVILPIFTGDHRENGIIILSGRNIKKGVEIEGASILDVTPTILALSGLPVGKDMDGEVLSNAIEEKFLQDNPIAYISSYEKFKQKETKDSKDFLIDEYREQLKERLKSLGYIQ